MLMVKDLGGRRFFLVYASVKLSLLDFFSLLNTALFHTVNIGGVFLKF
jgi:hypothetical protein